MFNKWERTTRKPIGGGMAVKTIDLREAERYIKDCITGQNNHIKKVVFADQLEIKDWKHSVFGGYDFVLSDDSMVCFDSWKYIYMEKRGIILFIYVTDIKPRME